MTEFPLITRARLPLVWIWLVLCFMLCCEIISTIWWDRWERSLLPCSACFWNLLINLSMAWAKAWLRTHGLLLAQCNHKLAETQSSISENQLCFHYAKNKKLAGLLLFKSDVKLQTQKYCSHTVKSSHANTQTGSSMKAAFTNCTLVPMAVQPVL